ncbi:hypothetical protein [Streptantibioticus silvisoli]|uniref:Uncharacterized protein n=1 Tax=Streptantibioticus silvisoli TaxID=2705255 RepID=A0ABT6W4X0_9ACTN|nr:hypothetical protein [Streptantibioticus silvisoli]MDI5965804.1 hypothetical protein [Streptantibioticus silvisoli]
MTAPVQPTLDGTLPPARIPAAVQRAEDYETWLAAVRPAYEAAAASGRPFTTYTVADAANLPEPPDPAHTWGRFMRLLADEGWIRTHGWTTSDRPTTHHSGVRTWIGTPAARRNAA